MSRHRAPALFTAAVALALLAAALFVPSHASAGPDCWYGEITLGSSPVLSAPSPAHPGDTITSTGGAWSACGGVPFTGFYKEWLRDGQVITGPNWVDGPPDSFTYTIQDADMGHEVRSAVSACNEDYGCYLPYAQSSNAIVPVATPPPPPPPPSPPPPPPPSAPVAVQGHVRDAQGSPVAGAVVALYVSTDPDVSNSQVSPLDRTTTGSDGSYALHAAPDGLVDAAGWANFAVEGTSGDVPYYAVATKQWTGSAWLGPEQADTPASDPMYPVLPEDVDLDPQGGSIEGGGGPDVQSPACWLAENKTSLVATERDPTIVGELHVARDAVGTFSYGEESKADSNISVATNLGQSWHINLGVFKHITRSDSSSVSESNPTADWAHDLLSDFVYAKYKHERISSFDGRVCSTWYTIEPKEWWGGIWPGADESRYLHKCLTTYKQFRNDFGPNSTFARSNYRLRTWGAAVSVGLGTGGLSLQARSGASQRVKFRYVFGRNRNHYLCGNDNRPAQSTRILAGG
jgi:hypothetical protein